MAIVEFSALTNEAQKNLRVYASHTQKTFQQIGEHLQNIYENSEASQNFTKQITNISNWNLKAIESSGLRLDSSKVAIKKVNNSPHSIEAGESVYGAISKNLTSAIKVCKKHIKESTDKDTSEWEKKLRQLEQDKILVDLMEIQAKSVLAEAVFDDSIDKLLDTIPKENKQDYNEIEKNIKKFKDEVSKYSLNTFSTENNKIPDYTSSDTLKVRKNILSLYRMIHANLKDLAKNKENFPETALDESLDLLNKAVGFANAKNDINYSNPSVVHPSTAIRHQVTSTLERVSLIMGIIAIGSSALAILTPVAMPVVGLTILLSACIGAITGLSAALIKSSNAIANYVLYNAKPTKEEVATAGIGAISVGVAGISQLGTLVTKTLSAGTSIAKTSVATVSQVQKTKKKQFIDFKEQLKECKPISTSDELQTKKNP